MLFGIGVGPGDPELLTLKAVRAIQRCDVIASPKTGGGAGTALSILEGYLDGKERVECHFAMEQDQAKRKEARRAAADQIAALLLQGKDVGFVTLGDPATYSTYMYLHQILAGKGFEAEIIPGITSYSAAAAALGIALCEDDEALTIIPAARNESIDRLLEFPGNKVIMKSGGNLEPLLATLKERGYADRTTIACRVTMQGERLYANIEDYLQSPESGYFTTVLVKERMEREKP